MTTEFTPSPAPSLVPTDRADAYWHASDPNHARRVAEVQASFQQAHGGAEPWREDGLERPSLAEPIAPYVLQVAPSPTPPRPDDV
jgi:hypothetical protein